MMILLLTALALAPSDSLLAGIQKKIDDSEARLKAEVYSFVATTWSKELDSQGLVKKVDTTVTWELRRGYETLADSIIYGNAKRPDRRKKMSRETPRLGDTNYVYEMPDSQVIYFRPKKLNKGDLSYRLGFDSKTLFPRWLEIEMPRPKLPVQEFRMRIEWTLWEDMLVPKKTRIQVSWKMLVMTGGMEVEKIFSDYRRQR